MKKMLLLALFLGSMRAMESPTPISAPEVAPKKIEQNKVVKVKYKNYRGEVGIRSIIPIQIYWGQTEYHPHDQWLVKVWDIEKNAERIYAFKDIQEFNC